MLLAIADRPVDNTGYEIQIFDVTDGNQVLATCANGSACSVQLVNPGQDVTIEYEACVDQGNPSVSLVCSQPVYVEWTHIIF